MDLSEMKKSLDDLSANVNKSYIRQVESVTRLNTEMIQAKQDIARNCKNIEGMRETCNRRTNALYKDQRDTEKRDRRLLIGWVVAIAIATLSLVGSLFL